MQIGDIQARTTSGIVVHAEDALFLDHSPCLGNNVETEDMIANGPATRCGPFQFGGVGGIGTQHSDIPQAVPPSDNRVLDLPSIGEADPQSTGAIDGLERS